MGSSLIETVMRQVNLFAIRFLIKRLNIRCFDGIRSHFFEYGIDTIRFLKRRSAAAMGIRWINESNIAASESACGIREIPI